MKRVLFLACLLAAAAGCATGGIEKRFTVVVDPPDAQITVSAGGGQSEQQYASPADIKVSIPKDPAEAAKGRLVVSRNTYKTMAISLNSIHGQTVRLKLEKALHYGLKFRMTGPVESDDFTYRDRILAVRLVPGDRQFHLKIENLSGKQLTLLWEESEYTDYANRPHRIIPTVTNPQDRRKAIPPQSIPEGGTLEENFIPVDSINYVQSRKTYETRTLFSLDTADALRLKGRTFSVFLTIEMDRAIIPDYNFRFAIADVVKE